jgi:Bacterial SH3 domain
MLVKNPLVKALLGGAIFVLLLTATASVQPLFAQGVEQNVASVPARVKGNANLRNGPGTNFKIVRVVTAGKQVKLIATNAKRNWYQLDTGEWIAAFLVESAAADTLPVSGQIALPALKDQAKPTAQPVPTEELACQRPPNDLSLAELAGETVNARTLWMLQLAQQIYGGPGSILRVVQGSYEPGLSESFGTHDGGGAVDISLRNPAKPAEVLWDEAPKMVAAMRKAGFAAWYRPTGMFGANSGAHIHAIAVGDPDLSLSARQQLDGPEGYFRGLDGVPPDYGGPHVDPHGGPLICPWMIELGYSDLR